MPQAQAEVQRKIELFAEFEFQEGLFQDDFSSFFNLQFVFAELVPFHFHRGTRAAVVRTRSPTETTANV